MEHPMTDREKNIEAIRTVCRRANPDRPAQAGRDVWERDRYIGICDVLLASQPAFGHWNSVFTRFRDWVRRTSGDGCSTPSRTSPTWNMPWSTPPSSKSIATDRAQKILWSDGRLSIGRLGSGHLDQEAPMAFAATPVSPAETASATLFVALELSRSTWLVDRRPGAF
jgi:hypothetical protein